MARPTKVVTIAGARPQFVKAFALSRVLAATPDFEEVLVHTGQHFDDNMSAIFFEELALQPPKYHFSAVSSPQTAAMAHMITGIEAALAAEQPDAVLVYGDTDSTLAGAIAACKRQLPLVHVEAGMRSFDRRMPEETNRIVADHLSALLLCVTPNAVENLGREGLVQNVHLVGDLMYDATLLAAAVAERRSNILDRLQLKGKEYGVATVHRAANTDEPDVLARILDFIAEEARRQTIVFPVHPRTARAAASAGLELNRPGMKVIEPLGYLGMCKLLHHASVVLTDSGGLQKEAYFHRVPCVTLREETEWVETIACGWNRLWTVPDYAERQEIADFGDGNAAAKIAECVRAQFAS